jgi:hypothetical protein
VYAWIWRKLPFGLPGKLIGSLLLAGAAVALLWFFVFPWAEPLLPFDDVQVTQDGSVPGSGPGSDGVVPAETTPDPRESGLDDHDLPYSTATPTR